MEKHDFVSKSVKDLTCTIINYNGTRVDVTDHVLSFSIYESIFNFSLVGEVFMFDKGGLIDTIPIMGQEIFTIEYTKADTDYEFEFYIADVKEYNELTEGSASYTMYLSGKKEMLNGVNTFSKSYSGLASEIMNKICTDYLDTSIDNLSASGNSMNIVIPFMKPFDALKMIMKNSLSLDRSPLFLFENVFNEFNLIPLSEMQSADPKVTLIYGQDINNDKSGESLRNAGKRMNKAFNQAFRKGFDSYQNITAGGYSSFVNAIDLATKNYERHDYSYTSHAPYRENMNDTVTNSWKINNSIQVNKAYESKMFNGKFNSLAFENSFNFNGTDQYQKAIIESYNARMDTFVSTAYTNSIEGLKSGDKVVINFKRPIPNIGDNDDTLFDEHLSGEYIISSLRHQIKRDQYSYTMELIKEGTNREL